MEEAIWQVLGCQYGNVEMHINEVPESRKGTIQGPATFMSRCVQVSFS